MRSNAIFWGVILILAGGLFLLGNLNILNVDVGSILWPLVIIVIGIWMLAGFFFRRGVATEHANISLEGASQAKLLIRHGAGRLNLSAGAAPGDLLEGDFGGGLKVDSHRSGEKLDVAISPKDQWMPPFWGGPGYSLDWNLSLAKDLPLYLELETGANEARIDLSELLVTDLRLGSGASSTQITMPANAGSTRAKISTGAASVKVRIPQGVAARIQARGGLASILVDSARFPRSSGIYESSDYAAATNKIDLDIETGVGSVEVN
jgi:hypothetical protein